MPTDSNVTEKRARLSPAKLALLEQRLRGANSLDSGQRPDSEPATRWQSAAVIRAATSVVSEPNGAGQCGLQHLGRLQLRGPLDLPALEKAVNAIVARHEILRTSFAVSKNEPVQIINPTTNANLPREDLSKLSGWPRTAS